MSKAFCCDKCGTCFNPVNMEPDEVFITIHEMIDQDAIAYKTGVVKGRYSDRHLCPDCSRKFVSFMKNEKENEDYVSENAGDYDGDSNFGNLFSMLFDDDEFLRRYSEYFKSVRELGLRPGSTIERKDKPSKNGLY